jgi:hypothetical protein
LVAASGVVAFLTLVGCAAQMKAKAGEQSSPTGGVALRMYLSDGRTSHALYVVTPDGSISFGGGFEAPDGQTTWTGAMTTEEIDELRGLLERHGWFRAAPGYNHSLASDPMDRWLYRIEFAFPATDSSAAGRWSLDRHGAGPDIAPIRKCLERAAMKRNQAVFDQLPVPNEGR